MFACLYKHKYSSDIDVTPLQKILATGLVYIATDNMLHFIHSCIVTIQQLITVTTILFVLQISMSVLTVSMAAALVVQILHVWTLLVVFSVDADRVSPWWMENVWVRKQYNYTIVTGDFFISVYCPHLHSPLDINECAFGPGQCSQLCINTQGSFTCGCQEGFRLDTDGRGCISKFLSTDSIDQLML